MKEFQISNCLKLLLLGMIVPLVLLAETDIRIQPIKIGGDQSLFDFSNNIPSIHNQGASAEYFTFTLEEEKKIIFRAFMDNLLDDETMSYPIHIYIIEGSEINGTLITDAYGKSNVSLAAGTYTVELSPIDSNAQGIGFFDTFIYIKPTRWSRIDYSKELYTELIGITKDQISTHRAGSYASYFNLIIKENEYLSIDVALFDMDNPEIQADPYVYIIKGESEDGKVISEGSWSVTEALEPGIYTIEVATKEPGIEIGGDMFIRPAVPINIVTDMILNNE